MISGEMLLLGCLSVALMTAQTAAYPSVHISSVAQLGLKPITERPENVAVYAGETVVLRCSVDQPPPASRVLWVEMTAETGGKTISDNENVQDSHPSHDRYRIIHLTDSEFHLEIRNVRLSDGGQYICQDVRQTQTYRASAQLIVLESKPVCTPPLPSDGITLEGQSFTTECVLYYHGNIRPTMTWTGPPPFEATYSPPDPFRVWARLSFTVQRDMDDQYFQCLTHFTELGQQPEDMATNLPTFQNADRTQIFVYWPPKDIQISPIKEEYQVGDVIEASVDARPAAFIAFQNQRTLEIYNGPTFTVSENLRGTVNLMRCQAQNIIQGFIYQENFFFYLNVQA